jgi:thiamine-phosphate pyrophosphorylase
LIGARHAGNIAHCRMRGLYAIIDPAACANDALLIATAVLRGGCAALQLRDKQCDDASFVALGRKLSALCRTADVPFFVNDRYWLAAELGAQGVHIGQGDAALADVRRALGHERLIGVSTHDLAQARSAEQAGADLIGFGPIFVTRTKLPAEPAVGLEALTQVCASVSIPVVAIGGLTRDSAAAAASAGADMGAVISALCGVSDPEAAARVLHAALQTPASR